MSKHNGGKPLGLRPLHNAVVIEPLPEQNPYQGVLVLPATAMHGGSFGETGGTVGDYSDRGVVVAVGAGYKYGRKFRPDFSGAKTGTWEPVVHEKPLPLHVKLGDVVLYAHKGGEDHEVDGRLVRIIPESQIEAVLES